MSDERLAFYVDLGATRFFSYQNTKMPGSREC